MGQKCNPRSFRLAVRKKWQSLWYADKKNYGSQLFQDLEIRRFLMKKSSMQGTSSISIRRMSEKIEVIIHTSRPGLVIGKKGSDIDILRTQLGKMTGKEVWIEVEEIKRPDVDAQLVATSISAQLKRRIAFRRAMKKAIQQAMDGGAKGIKVELSGRLNGAEIARSERYMEGSVPLHTLRADIDYATARAETTYGSIGVKVWINKGERMTPKRAATPAKSAETANAATSL